MRTENISVCMATYNGSAYVVDQINSILNQLIDGDELIIIDDSSSDNTREKILDFKSPKINLIVNSKNLGVNCSFEKAIKAAKKEYIFLADQDDIWLDNRIEIMMDSLRDENVNLVSGNSIFVDELMNTMKYTIGDLEDKDSSFMIKNLVKIFKGTAGYYGCAMGFKKDLTNLIIPFPKYIESHDLWIAKASILDNKSRHLEDKVLYRRIHGENASVIERPLNKKIRSRWIFLMSILELIKRKLKTTITRRRRL